MCNPLPNPNSMTADKESSEQAKIILEGVHIMTGRYINSRISALHEMLTSSKKATHEQTKTTTPPA